ncbi:PTS glucose transporter subunit IIA [Mycoplasma sp. CSL10137]|uniref:PTS glucose transporter subunit IIA n=1 Tax=unclassified Mycoplasma TaxID=2683645 RepID=UPI00197C0FB0|nr:MULTISPECIES: PTS glucose transporter subunit IIA [unclassified Mycoplasma]MBN4083305.1 PTS glucose transporter subunit IIA [Mycoplasma sp. CSL10137]MBN4084392.1 PTS glucose transporter subunit IIA [Mycoplasma sp. CSL10166]MBU4692878.1 PTS glucose transporter subunit IIA [Mycoplasma sp. CSL7491-lung]
MSNLNKWLELLESKNLEHAPQEVQELTDAMGGIKNIVSFNNSVSQLRYDLRNPSLVNEELLKKLGAKKVNLFTEQKYIQVEMGDIVETINKVIKKYASVIVDNSDHNLVTTTNNVNAKGQKASKEMEVVAPLSGKVVSLESLKDGVFSNGLVGNGLAIKMEGNSKVELLAPFNGRITSMPASKTQFIFKTNCDVELIVLIGQDSYKLDGLGIEGKVSLNEEVKAGDTLFVVDLEKFTNEKIDKTLIISTTSDSRLKKVIELEELAVSGKKLFKLS